MYLPEREPEHEGDMPWLRVGYYAARLVDRVGELGGRACRAFAHNFLGASEPPASTLEPNVAPLLLSKRDQAHLELLYSSIDYPHQLSTVILELQQQDPGNHKH